MAVYKPETYPFEINKYYRFVGFDTDPDGVEWHGVVVKCTKMEYMEVTFEVDINEQYVTAAGKCGRFWDLVKSPDLWEELSGEELMMYEMAER